MDTLKIFQSVIKDVFHHIHSSENRAAPSVRMSEILNISQISQNSELKSNNSINSRILKTMIEKERKNFLDELLVVTNPEVTLSGINQKSDYKLSHDISRLYSKEETKNHEHDRCSQMDLDYGEDNHTNMKRMNSFTENECSRNKNNDISKRLQNHDVSQKVFKLFGENESQELEVMQISLGLEAELSKEVRKAFEVLKNNNDTPKGTESSAISNVEKQHIRSGQNCSVGNHTAERIGNGETDKDYEAMLQNNISTNDDQQNYRRSAKGWVDVHHTENDVNEGCNSEEGEEEDFLRGDISDSMSAIRSSGSNMATPRLKDSEEKYYKSCANHVTSKRIIDGETNGHSPSTKSTRNKHVPVMGKTALLQRASIDQADYLIIQDLILAKYSNKIRQYLERNHKRRESRCEHFEEYLTAGQYTPSSISSLDHLNSFDGYGQKAGLTFSSLERDNKEKNVINSMTSSPFVQNTTHSYSMNDILNKNSRSSCSSSESNSRINGNSTKLISQEGEEMFLQKSGVEGSEDCIQCLEYSISSYEQHDSNQTQFDTDKASRITYESTSAQNSDKNLSFTKSVDDPNIQHPANTSMGSTYSVSKFIENALGGMNPGQEHMNNNDTIESALYQNINCSSIHESISTSKISDLLSKGSTLTNGLTRGRQLIRADSLYETETQDSHMELELLTTELSIQNQILLQASKAVKHCRVNDILHTTGYIEAERILLLTSETKKALNEEIHNIESKKYFNKDESTLSTGQIDIKNIVLELDASTSHSDKHLEVFLVLVKCGRQVCGSRVLQSKKSKIIFDRSITLERLTADFRICIELYSMTVDFQKHHQHSCLTSMDIFHVNRRSKGSSFINEDSSLNVSSAFTLAGRCDMRISDLTKTDGTGKLMLKLQNISEHCTIPDKVCLTVRSKLKLNSCLRGFLTIGTQNEHCCIIWNRRWCMLKGSTLVYWNHPSEEEFTPNGSINLRDCTENYIVIAERHLCSRPRTLMLPIKEGEDVKKYFLATDDNIDLDTWDKQLNLTIRALKVWKNSEIC